MAIWYLAVLGLFVGLSDMFGGYDRYIYAEIFDGIADVTSSGGNPWKSSGFFFYGSELGWSSMNVLLSYVTANRYIFIFVVTIIIYVLLILSLKKYAENFPFAIIIFLGLWVFFTFTYLRQVLGCTIAWLSIQYIYERNFKRFLLVWLIAFSFHNSALVFFPMYFIPLRKFKIQTIVAIMLGALILGLTPFPHNLFAIYGEVDADRVGVAGYSEEGGFRIAYLIESLFFLYVIFTNYRIIPNKPKDIVLLNIALVFCAVLLLFIRSENGGRLGWYYLIGIFCTLSTISIRKQMLTIQGVGLIFVALLLYLRIFFAWQTYMNLYPYKTFLTNGHREGDPVWEQYEYDENYDKDKFYR